VSKPEKEFVQLIQCVCGEGEELGIDEQRHHSQTFEWLQSFHAVIGHDDHDKLIGRAIYQCPCGRLVVNEFSETERED